MTSDLELLRAAEAARDVDRTTFGRRAGLPSRRTIWITADSRGRIHVRSGQGLVRDWTLNLLANGRAILHVAGKDVPVRARHVTDRAELRASHDALSSKYAWQLPMSQPGQPLTLAEQATF